MKVSFSLNKSNVAKAAPAPSLKQSAAFGSLDDDEPIDAAPTASSSSSRVDVNKRLAAQASGHVSKSLQKRLEAEKMVDETVYEYDEVWDKMQEAKLRQKEKKEVEAQQKKPKYIGSLLQAATVRKLDHLRAEEKMIQREREQEGDEFADKDQFVTQAYKDQMAEVRKAEEEEKKREEAEKAKRKSTTGLSYFYRQMLDQNEKEHSATVEATQELANGKKVMGPAGGPPVQNLTIQRPVDLAPMSDLEKAKLAEAEGKQVELNDDNQIVDKRDLLSAGLNLSAPNTRRLGLGSSKSKEDKEGGVRTHTAVGSAASSREINERRRREIERQMAEEKERTKEEHDRRERERMQRTVAKRNTEEDVKSARERYLERKRRRVEEPAENPEGRNEGGGGT